MAVTASLEEVGGDGNRRRRPRGVGDGIFNSRRTAASRLAWLGEEVEDVQTKLLVSAI